MMKILYTGAINANEPQSDPNKSLGGYISSSQVPNGLLHNLFPELSQNSHQVNSPNVKCIALLNDSIKEEVSIWFEQAENSKATFEIAIAKPALNDCNEPYFEQLPEVGLPFFNFHKANQESPFLVGPLSEGQVLGIFIKRNSQFHDSQECTLNENGVEEFELIINWK